jgi:hypothetical protein
LLITGLNYQWILDLIGPLSLTPQHNQYVLVMIKYFSKCLELMPLPNRSIEITTYAFLDKTFSGFNVQVEVLTNQGMEFCGNFRKLCEKALIDH